MMPAAVGQLHLSTACAIDLERKVTVSIEFGDLLD